MDFKDLLQTTSQIFEAGIAITAFSLFIRSLTFNLKDRVSRAFALILFTVIIVYSGEALSSSFTPNEGLDFWLKFQWIGIVIFPAAFLNFSDALMETTGQPSRGRRDKIVKGGFVISLIFLILLISGHLTGPLRLDQIPHLVRTNITYWFSLFYLLASLFSGWTIWRAFKRTRIKISARRMGYLMSSAFILIIGTYPYMQIGTNFAQDNPLIFTGLATLGNLLVFFFLILMAYAVAFFGVSWPDRIVRSRLLKWLIRGPLTVFVVLTLMTSIYKATINVGLNIIAVPIITIITVVIFEHAITILFPFFERLVIHRGTEVENIDLLQNLGERLITSIDLKQFLDAVLAAACDQFQVNTGFVAAFDQDVVEYIVQTGEQKLVEDLASDDLFSEKAEMLAREKRGDVISWGNFWLFSLHDQQGNLIGMLGVQKGEDESPTEIQINALSSLGERAGQAIEDRFLQNQVFSALQDLEPKINRIQNLRAATRFDPRELALPEDEINISKDFYQIVKDALSHYWGGPKLTGSPLMKLEVVQEAMKDNEGNTVNALRSILKNAIENVRPEGERRFTGEWILFNILEMKFLEGRKVREIAMRLAMSEADLYRKQRIAIQEVSKSVLELERKAKDENGNNQK